jgi:hypothetical protein
MTNPKLPRKVAAKAKNRKPRRQGVEGLAAAAEKNRELEARLRIITAFGRLGISHNQWPDFVRAFYADPQQRIEFHQFMTPSPFQPPDFDRLKESPQDWVKVANGAWELHRNRFLPQSSHSSGLPPSSVQAAVMCDQRPAFACAEIRQRSVRYLFAFDGLISGCDPEYPFVERMSAS